MDRQTSTDKTSQTHFPPVVTVLGHVDHGKTSLLDAIRQTSVAKREFGGITQGIGASSVEVVYEGQKRRITFIDTPGHEAFTKMRSRGAQVADIGLLIISAVDGVMPQTRESIQILKESNLPFIVVLTMADLPTKNSEKVKQHLLRENILIEGYGGDVPVIEVSAKTGTNIKELLDLILLVSDLRGIHSTASKQAPLQAIVIESKMDSHSGPKATVIVRSGTIHTKQDVVSEKVSFRVRMLFDDLGKPLSEASVGQGVEVLGTAKVLPVGAVMTDNKAIIEPEETPAILEQSREVIYHRPQNDEGLSIVLLADTQGSLEAILPALPKGVTVVASKTGEITEADVLQAKATGAIVLGFNIKIRADVEKLAMLEKVPVKNYKIIYELLDEIADVIEGKKQVNVEIILGRAKVLASFPYEKTFAYGVTILEGRLARNDKVRIMRDDQVLGETTIHSVRVGKNPVSKAAKGEAGIVLTQPLDITIGDVLISIA